MTFLLWLKTTLSCLSIIAVAIICCAGVRFIKTRGTFIEQLAPVNPGECVEIELDVYRSVSVFGYRLPCVVTERRKVAGVTLHDYQSGKLIGRYHDAGVRICSHCNGVGEVDNGEDVGK